MSESGGSYDPGPWRGFDYKSARAAHKKKTPSYDPNAGRGYGRAKKTVAGKAIDVDYDCVPQKIKTMSKHPLLIACDGTGSMGKYPNVIFEKLPLLDNAGVDDYLPGADISFSMIGDATAHDQFPLQVQDFGRGKQLVDSLLNLTIEKGGGGGQKESYEVAATFFARNVEMPKAVNKPVLIFIADEGIYETVDKDQAKRYAKVDLQRSMPTKEIFAELTDKFSVYCIRKTYGSQKTDAEINDQWEGLLGFGRTTKLEDPKRIVDLILLILAQEVGELDKGILELEDRQGKDDDGDLKINTVMKSMRTIGFGPKTNLIDDGFDENNKSIMNRDGDSLRSKPLF